MKTLALTDEKFNIIKKVNYNSDEPNFKYSKKVLDISKLPKSNLLNHIPYGVDVLVPFDNGNDFVFIHPNPYILKLTNTSYNDFLGRKISDVLPLHNELGVTEILRDVYKTGELKTFKTMSHNNENDNNNFINSFKHHVFQENGYFFIISIDKTELELIKSLTNDLFYNNNQAVFFIEEYLADTSIDNKHNIFLNNLATDLTGYSIEDFTKDFNIFDKIFYKGLNREKFSSIIYDLFNLKIPFISSEIRFKTKSGKKGWLKINGELIFLDGANFIKLSCSDITESKNKEKSNLLLEKNINIIQKASKIALFHWNSKEGYNWTSEIYNIIEDHKEYSDSYHDIIKDYVVSEDYDFIKKASKDILKKGSGHGIFSIRTKKGTLKYLTFFAKYENHEGNFKSFDENLFSEHNFNFNLNSKLHFGSGSTTDFPNPNLNKYSDSSFINKFGDSKDSNSSFINKIKDNNDSDNSFINKINFKYPSNNKSKDSKLVIGYIQDITDIVIYEKELQGTLEDKKVLLKEVHHRVKNNLQIILSLLSLETRFNSDNPKKIIETTRNRIMTMSLIHEQIYKSEDLAHINIENYLKDIIKYLFDKYDVKNINLNYNIDNIPLIMSLAIPLSLILNELIINTILHGFPSKEEGNISISLKFIDDNIILIYEDDGVGFDENFDINSSSSLGLIVINSLVSQIDGEIIDLKPSKGVCFKIEFPKIYDSGN